MLPISHRGDQVFGTVPRVQCAAQSITGRDRVRRTAAEAAAGASFTNLSSLHIHLSQLGFPLGLSLFCGVVSMRILHGLSFCKLYLLLKAIIVTILYIFVYIPFTLVNVHILVHFFPFEFEHKKHFLLSLWRIFNTPDIIVLLPPYCLYQTRWGAWRCSWGWKPPASCWCRRSQAQEPSTTAAGGGESEQMLLLMMMMRRIFSECDDAFTQFPLKGPGWWRFFKILHFFYLFNYSSSCAARSK